MAYRAQVGARDRAAVARQLGRPPHPFIRVAARCPFGYPAVIENLPYDERGRPFPTLFYVSCPSLVAAVDRLESAGAVARWSAALASEARPPGGRAVRDGGPGDWLASLTEAERYERRRRRALARRYLPSSQPGGASSAHAASVAPVASAARTAGARRDASIAPAASAAWGAGIAGVSPANRLNLKCLHAHVAHALARPEYRLGRAIFAEVDDPWCADERCRQDVSAP